MNLLILFILLASDFVWHEDMPKDSVCMERGHIKSGVVSRTLMCDRTWIVDYEDSTVQYYYNSNYDTYRCSRCGKTFTEPVMTDTIRTVIWRREEKQ